MLVYANYLTFDGKESFPAVLASICSWIKYETGKSVQPPDLVGNKSFRLKNMWVETIRADLNQPSLYSLTFSFADKRIGGRQWSIETGIRVNSESTDVSCTVQIMDISCMVTGEIRVEMPLILQTILDNGQLSSMMKGKSVKTLGSEAGDCESLLYDIQRSDRTYPIILVSPTPGGKYLVDVEVLQKQITGMGQVVRIDQACDTFEMERVMGKNFSAWKGAINVVETPFVNGHIRNKLFRPGDCSDGKETYDIRENRVSSNAISQMVAAVTHNTNVPMMKKHIKAHGVKAKSIRETYTKTGPVTQNGPVEDIQAGHAA